MALSTWWLTPEYINRRWTEEILQLMLDKLSKRLRASNPREQVKQVHKIPDMVFLGKYRKHIGYHTEL